MSHFQGWNSWCLWIIDVLQFSCCLISCGRNSERSQMVWLPLWPKSWLSPESLWLSFVQIVDVSIKQSEAESAIPNFTASSASSKKCNIWVVCFGIALLTLFVGFTTWHHMTVLPKYRKTFHQGQILVQEEEQQHMWRYRFCEALARGVQKSQAAATKQADGWRDCAGFLLDQPGIEIVQNMSLVT